MAVNTPAITANAHPLVITIHPAPSAFERFKTTFATTPLPSKMSMSVPMNSPKHFASIQHPLLVRILLPDPIERLAHRSLPKPVHFIPFCIREVRLPGALHSPVLAEVL